MMLCNTQKVTDNVNEFNQVLGGLLHSIQNEAASGDSELKFATGSSDYGDYKKIYGLMQCSPDLSYRDCFNCLGDYINRLPDCCNNSVGAQILGSSCKIRYEDYLFYNNKSYSPPQSSPPSPTSSTPSPTSPPPSGKLPYKEKLPRIIQSFYDFSTIILPTD